ncbi:ABC transporter substrate-binding protein [Actinopolymorpha singaporensis]
MDTLDERSGNVSRRRLLIGSALAAVTTTIAACSGSSTNAGGRPSGSPKRANRKGSPAKPLAAPRQLHEAPALAKRVRDGELPAVGKRVPGRPYVVPHRWLRTGKYGGTLRMPASASTTFSPTTLMYGHAPLRWLNDSQDLGPGLVESWESNDDASQWTLHMREGVRWSDGAPLTSADAMYWWKDLVLNGDYPAEAPDSGRSSKGTPMRLSAPDAYTLVMDFDAPSPVVIFQLARYVQWDVWFQPRHYLKQFHLTYNSKAGEDWTNQHAEKMNYAQNPDCPTLTGWKLRSYREGVRVTWERNPYYWCVDPEGNQLPYIDVLSMPLFQDPQVGKLQVQNGQADYAGSWGASVPLGLADVSGLKRSAAKSRTRVLLWNTGTGGTPAFFFNHDYENEAMRKLIRTPAFRQALSHAHNREDVRKTLYFNTGQITTGTHSTQSIEYHTPPEGPKIYKSWKDSYSAYDPEKAKRMLDKLGVVDSDGDGLRNLPNGEKLSVVISYSADSTEESVKYNQLLKRDWEKIGVSVKLDPRPPTVFGEQWERGELMSQGGWGLTTLHDHLVLYYWFCSTEPSVWAPLQAQWWKVRGTPAEHAEADVSPWKRTPPRLEPDKGGPVDRLWQGLAKALAEPEALRRTRTVWDMIRIHVEEGPFFQCSVANFPTPLVVHQDLRNVPSRDELAYGGLANTWSHPTPAVYDPEAYYWENPSEHT